VDGRACQVSSDRPTPQRVSIGVEAILALLPALQLLTRFFHDQEREQVRALLADGRRRVSEFRARHGDVEEYAEDPLRDL